MKTSRMYLVILALLHYDILYSYVSFNKRIINHKQHAHMKKFRDISFYNGINMARPQISLDSPVVPTTRLTNLNDIKTTTILAIIIMLILYFLKSLSLNKLFSIFSNFSIPNFLSDDLISTIQLGSRVIKAKLSMTIENIVRSFNENILQQKPVYVNTDQWNVCALKERELLPGDYVRYRFTLPDPNSILSLYAGQELLLCTVDGTDEVLKDSFYPVTSDTTKGYFDIIINRNVDEKNEKFINVLESLAVGEELGFKEGSMRLNYRGSFDSIDNIVILTSGLGITPTIQILYQLLNTNIKIKNIELLWLNSNKNDFIYNKVIENLELRYFEKFLTSKILDNNLYNKDISKINLVDDSVPMYKPGRIAIVCAPDFYTKNLTEYLVTKKKYPIGNVIVIDTLN